MGSLPQDQIKDVHLRVCRAWQIEQGGCLSKGVLSVDARAGVARRKQMFAEQHSAIMRLNCGISILKREEEGGEEPDQKQSHGTDLQWFSVVLGAGRRRWVGEGGGGGGDLPTVLNIQSVPWDGSTSESYECME